MAKLAIVATIKTVPGRRDEYLKHLRAHANVLSPPANCWYSIPERQLGDPFGR